MTGPDGPDDPADDWKPGVPGDTSVEFDATEFAELDATARRRMDTPTTSTHHTLDWLAGYEAGVPEGEQRGAARVLDALRARLVRSGDTEEEAAHSAAVIARLAGFQLH